MLQIINQIFEIEKKSKEQKSTLFDRNFQRISQELEELGYIVLNPLGEMYDERNTSLEVNITGDSENPVIVKVLKPAILQKDGDEMILIQKGIVIAE